MFKSIFSKYFVAFVAIISICFSMLLLVGYDIVVHYVSDANVSSAQEVAQGIAQTVLEQPSLMEDDQSALLSSVLNLATAGNDALTVLAADPSGEIVASASNYDAQLSHLAHLPDALMTQIGQDELGDQLLGYRDAFGNNRPLAAVALRDAQGQMRGAVVVCVPTTHWIGFLNAIARAVVMASLWIMLAALIAVYFISERVSSPLRDMRRAAKEFAGGNFERRVVVHGKDEIAELGIAFNQMAQSLENLEKLRGGFMASVSHELRTPMTTIAGFVDAIRDGVIPPEKQDHYLGVISTEVHRLARLVSSLLDVSRIQAGERKFVKKPFDICEMGRQIIISLEQRIEEKQLQLEFVCDEENMLVSADHDAIYQVFYNICENAVKFSSEGGAFVVTVSRLPDKKHKLQVSVYNQGAGIAAEDLPFVFERFYKGDKSRGLDRNGVGLGLYICKTIIAAHGEDIWASSAQGKDCKFSFTLTEEDLPRI